MDFFYLLINLSLIISGLILGIILFLNPVPKTALMKNYRFSSKMLGISYILLSTINALVLSFGLMDYQPEFLKISGIVISSTQALVFTYILVALLNPKQRRGSRNLFVIHAAVIMAFMLLYTVGFLLGTDPVIARLSDLLLNISNPLVVLRVLFFVFYMVQMLHYSLIFVRAVRKYNASIDNYFSETRKLKLNWVIAAFCSALVIGLLAIVFQTMPGLLFDNIFTTVVVAFYIVFAIKFIRYNALILILEPALDENNAAGNNMSPTQVQSGWMVHRQKVLERKLHLRAGITLREMALLLNISRPALSHLINTEEHQHFNSWINQLRIAEAKELMIKNPEYPVSFVAIRTGYSGQAVFSLEFKQITGETPLAWKKSTMTMY